MMVDSVKIIEELDVDYAVVLSRVEVLVSDVDSLLFELRGGRDE